MEERTSSLLKEMAPLLDSLEPVEGSQMSYCLFSDAILWEDEVPRQSDAWCVEYSHVMRAVFRHRTAILLGQQDNRFSDIYDAAGQLFPNWPGFSHERLTCTPEVRRFYEESKRRGNTDSDEYVSFF